MDYSGITFPVTIKQIPQIERQNQISINVFGYNEKRAFPVRISTENYHDHIELLYIEKEQTAKDQTVKNHYVYIKDFSPINVQFYKT